MRCNENGLFLSVLMSPVSAAIIVLLSCSYGLLFVLCVIHNYCFLSKRGMNQSINQSTKCILMYACRREFFLMVSLGRCKTQGAHNLIYFYRSDVKLDGATNTCASLQAYVVHSINNLKCNQKLRICSLIYCARTTVLFSCYLLNW